ncbi:MAG: hypothetical protein EHM70_08040 [Chloroflexota bacterium]|nr:MAG: hypothetical protein EHM70_08040 [Chloroflexota bacterium]
MFQDTIEKTFAVTGPARLRLSNIRGSTEVLPGEDGIISIVAIKHLDTGDAERTDIRIYQAGDGSVCVETRYDWFGWWLSFSRPCKVEYIVRVPARCDVRLSGVSNSTILGGLEGNLDLHSVSGSLSLRDLKGQVKINSVSGDVACDGTAGSLDLETVSGDATLTHASLARVSCSTVSGDIHLQLLDAGQVEKGPFRFKSVSGDVWVILPSELGVNIELNSISGRLRSNFTLDHFDKSGRWVKADCNGGGALVYLNSISGDLHIGGAESRPVTQPGEVAHASSAMEILEKIEQGKLSVAEGLAMLG